MDIFGPKVIESKNIEKNIKRLNNEIYSNVPKSECLGCPMKGGIGNEVVAECCRRSSPPLYLIEFINVYNHIKSSWPKEHIEDLFYHAFETLFNENKEKPCILLDQQTNKCRIYGHRWLNCRTYGMTPDSEWKTRAKFWVKEVLKPKFTIQKVEVVYVDSAISGIDGKPIKIKNEILKNVVDEEALDKYVDELFSSEEFDPDKINSKIIKDYNVKPLLYKQCKNLKIDNPHMGLHNLYEKLLEIEASFIHTEKNKLPDTTYMAFHIYLLLFVLGDDKLETLIVYSEKATDEQKKMFLLDIKKNLSSLAESFCE